MSRKELDLKNQIKIAQEENDYDKLIKKEMEDILVLLKHCVKG